ncbi:MAG: hypothetical protein AVO39_02770 [delta proteobacterium MLS_D]|nr:MAG: hypothetical protein AVO39_02770 [delta proteobacterium MLS_D]
MARVPEALAEKFSSLPAATGVYLMKDHQGRIIYVGKAKNLRSRVRSYFGDGADRPVIPFLRARIDDFDYVLTATEKEALILENALIKKHRPRYNVMLRDDKNYFSIRLDTRADFPRFELVRRMKKDGARYFGPYASSTAVKETLHLLNRFFPLRTCRDREFASRRRPCVEYQIGRCSAPCVGYVGKDDYAGILREAVLFMEGRQKRLASLIRQKMRESADSLNFEEAARLRDLLGAMEQTFEKQRIVDPSFRDRDVFGLAGEDGRLSAYMISVRAGTVADQRVLRLPAARATTEEVVASLLKQHYDDSPFIPREVVIPVRPDDGRVIEEWLSDRRSGRVRLVVPQRGVRRDLLRMAEQNAVAALRVDREQGEKRAALLEELAAKLGLRAVPHRIECFDISNIQGRNAVGSQVVFTDGVPDKNRYRRYKIRTVKGADDYAMMYEVLKRRFAGDSEHPDLVVVDGGRGQLAVALRVLKESGIDTVDVLGLAKETRREKTISGGLRTDTDRVYLPGRKNPLYLSRSPELLRILQAVRDEAHRFAITYHRTLKQKEDITSELDKLPGIGPAKKRALLAHFKTVSAIRQAATEQLAEVRGIGPVLAEVVKKGT